MENPSEEVNPYQSPGAVAKGGASAHSEEAASIRSYLAWAAVFFANLAYPLVVGWLITAKGGRWGVIGGSVLLFVVGCWLCTKARGLAKALLVGGVAVGFVATVVTGGLLMSASMVSGWAIRGLFSRWSGRKPP